MERHAVILALLLAVAMVISGCGQAAPPAKPDPKPAPAPAPAQPAGPKPGGTLVIGVDTEPNTTDIFQMTWSGGMEFLYESLLTKGYDSKYADGLAESFSVSPDGLEWTFKIKKGVKFHNGVELTAQSVKDYIDLVKDPKVAATQAIEWEFVDKVSVVDSHTLKFGLKSPFPNTPFRVSTTYQGLMEPKAYRDMGPLGSKKWDANTAIGTGPFKLVKWVPQDRLFYERNNDYVWGPSWAENKKAPYIEKLEYRIIPDAATRLSELETGKVHLLLSLPMEHVERAKQIKNVTVHERAAFGLGSLAFRLDKKPWDNPKLRQAVGHAIDREAIIKAVFFGLYKPAYGYTPTQLAGTYQDKDAFKYDPELAKKLLAEAGYPNGLSTTISVRNTTELVRVAEAVQQMLAKVGIKAEIKQYDRATMTARARAGDFELYIWSYSWADEDILQWFLESTQAPSPNVFGWNDKKTDQLIKEGETAKTMDGRAQKYIELQKHLIANRVWVPIWHPVGIVAVRSDIVKNYKPHPHTNWLNDLWMEVPK